MVGQFMVVDTIRKHYAASNMGPERTDFKLILLDQGQCPMRQMPQYVLESDGGEIEKFSAGQLNGKSIQIEVREMNGRGNPTMRGRIIGPVANGK